jgi:hypothetical protein
VVTTLLPLDFSLSRCRQGGVTLDRDADVEIVDILVFGYLPSWRPCEHRGSVWRVTLQSGSAGAAL